MRQQRGRGRGTTTVRITEHRHHPSPSSSSAAHKPTETRRDEKDYAESVERAAEAAKRRGGKSIFESFFPHSKREEKQQPQSKINWWPSSSSPSSCLSWERPVCVCIYVRRCADHTLRRRLGSNVWWIQLLRIFFLLLPYWEKKGGLSL